MELFRKVKMEGAYWGVFLVNPNDINDRYLVTSTFAKESDAEHFTVEFNRIAEEAAKAVAPDSASITDVSFTRKFRQVRLED
jgi:hypothetical protein